MLQINISTRPSRLDYNIQDAKLNLQSTQPQLQMETTPATLEIQQPRGKLTIDHTPCYYSIGIKNVADFARDNAALGRQTVMEATARIVQEGNQLARIENKSDAISDIAVDSSLTEVPEITWAPIASPNINYQASPLQINIKERQLNYTVQPGNLQGDFQPGSLDIRIAQYASIEMSAVDVKV